MSKAPLISALAHVCLRTNDLGATERFYSEGLGLPVLFRFTKKGDAVGFYLKIAERQFIEVFYNDTPEAPSGNAALAHYCLETPDIHGLRTRLVGLGFNPTEVKEGCDKSLQFWVSDPSGVHFEFHQYGPESRQLVGGDVEINW